MSLKKIILPAGVLLVILSCHQKPKPEITTSYDIHFETLHGKVKQLREMYRDDKHVPLETDVTDFDTAGNVIQMKNTGSCNCLIKYVYTYDKAGKKITITTKDSIDDLYFPKPVYKYDTYGHMVEVSSKEKNNIELQKEYSYVPGINKYLYKYDAAGNRIQEDCYFNREHQFHMTYKYDDKHLLIEEQDFNSDDKKPTNKISYHYTSFDSKGNWLRRVGETEDYGGPPRQEIREPVVTRRITYY